MFRVTIKYKYHGCRFDPGLDFGKTVAYEIIQMRKKILSQKEKD